MYTVTIDISENEALKTLLGSSLQSYVDYKCDGETMDDDRLNKLRKEITGYIKKMLTTNLEVSVTYSVNNDMMDVGAIISLGLK